MKKITLSLLFLLFLLPLASAITFKTTFNPFTGKLDYYTDDFGDGGTINASNLNISGSIIISSLVSCDTIDSDANGVLSCGTDATGAAADPDKFSNENFTNQLAINISNGNLITPANTTWASEYGNVTDLSQLNNDAGFLTSAGDDWVNESGDTMSGNLTISPNLAGDRGYSLGVFGNNTEASTVEVSGPPVGFGLIKATLFELSGLDHSNSAVLSLKINGTQTTSQGIYLDMNESSGNPFTITNRTVNIFRVNSEGDAEVYGNLDFSATPLSFITNVRGIDTVSNSALFFDAVGTGQWFFRNSADATLVNINEDEVDVQVPFFVGDTLNATGEVKFGSLTNCDTIDTDANGILSCGTDADTITLTDDLDIVNQTMFDNGTIIRDHNTSWVTANEQNPTNATIEITESQISDLAHTVDTTIGNCSGTNSCSDIVYSNNGTWAAGFGNLTEDEVEAYIFDGDNTGTLSSGTLALSSLSYTGNIGDAEVANTISISNAGSVHWGALNNYPTACTSSETITGIGDTITCTAISITESQISDLQAYLTAETDSLANGWIDTNVTRLWTNTTDLVGALAINRTLDEIGDEANRSLINYVRDTNTSMKAYVDSVAGADGFSDESDIRNNITNYLGGSGVNGSLIKVSNTTWAGEAANSSLLDYIDSQAAADGFSDETDISNNITNYALTYRNITFINTTDSFTGEVSGTYDSGITLSNTALDDQYVRDDELNGSDVKFDELNATSINGTDITLFNKSIDLSGYSEFGASIDDTEMTAEDFGDFTNAGGEDGFTLDANTVTDNEVSSLSWSELNNYPTACTSSETITTLGDTITCTSISITESQISDLQAYLTAETDALANGWIDTNITRVWQNVTALDSSTNASMKIYVDSVAAADGFSDEADIRNNITNYLGGSEVNGSLIKVGNTTWAALEANSSLIDYIDSQAAADGFSDETDISNNITNYALTYRNITFINTTDSFTGEVSGTYETGLTLSNTALDDQYVDVDGDTMTGDLTISGTADLYIGDDIFREGDTNTVIQGSADQWNFVTGGSTRFTVNNNGVQVSNGDLDLNNNNLLQVGNLAALINNESIVRNKTTYTQLGTINFTNWITAENGFQLDLTDNGNDMILHANVGGVNSFTIDTDGAFMEIFANPGAANDYEMFAFEETQGDDTSLNFYEGGTGRNRLWSSGSVRIGGDKGSTCSTLDSRGIVDCNTASTGADLVIQDELAVLGAAYLANGSVNITDSGDLRVNSSIFQEGNKVNDSIILDTTPVGGEVSGTIGNIVLSDTALDDNYIELGDSFGGEVSGTYDNLVLSNTALDDQYVLQENTSIIVSNATTNTILAKEFNSTCSGFQKGTTGGLFLSCEP